MKELNQFNAPSLSQFIDPSLISVQKNYVSKEECLEAMVAQLLEKQYVNEEFRESIFNREKAGVTCMDSGVALPHADSSTIIRSSISILTLKKPVDWGFNYVSLIIMVCLNEEQIEMFKPVIQELYQIIMKKAYIDQIIQINSVDTMLHLFYKK